MAKGLFRQKEGGKRVKNLIIYNFDENCLSKKKYFHQTQT